MTETDFPTFNGGACLSIFPNLSVKKNIFRHLPRFILAVVLVLHLTYGEVTTISAQTNSQSDKLVNPLNPRKPVKIFVKTNHPQKDITVGQLFKELVNENYQYLSVLDKEPAVYEWGDTIALSNKVTKGDFNVAGKPVLIRLVKQGEKIFQSWRPFKKTEWFPHQKKVGYQTKQEIISNRQHQFKEVAPYLFEPDIIYSNFLLTDHLGEVNFNLNVKKMWEEQKRSNGVEKSTFIAKNFYKVGERELGPGNYTLAVFFLNSQYFYTEHVNFLSFNLVNQSRLNYTLMLPFLLLFVISFVILLAWGVRKKGHWLDHWVSPFILLFYKLPTSSIDLRKLLLYQVQHGAILLSIAILIHFYPVAFLLALIGLLLFRRPETTLLVLEGILLWVFKVYLVEFAHPHLDSLVGKETWMILFFLANLAPVLPFYLATEVLAAFHSIYLAQQLAYIVIVSAIVLGLVFLLFHHGFNFRKLFKKLKIFKIKKLK